MDYKQDSFPASEETDGLRNSEKIKILLCYLIKTAGQPLSKDFLLTTLYSNSIANYFEISQALYELEKVDALRLSESGDCGVYVLTASGRKIADELQNELSAYIKHKATSAVLKVLISEKRNKENKVEITKTAGGKYRVHISLYSLPETESEEDKLLDVSIYVVDEMQAEVIKKSFFNNPTVLYENVISALTENVEFKANPSVI